jgi:hypothetical protein
MRQAQLATVIEVIAVTLFGSDAYRDPLDPMSLFKDELVSFVETLLAYQWNLSRKTTISQHQRLMEGKQDVDDGYQGM